jgi:ABC-type branched-subunit amino acid transport system substrate-binding protein
VASRFQRRCFRKTPWRRLDLTLGGPRALTLLILPLLIPLLVRSAPALKEGPAVPGELVIGQSAPFSGPNASYGLDYRQGARAWFDAVNRRGGIHGRKLRLVSLDDRYEPELTLSNTRQLLQNQQVVALFGFFGTPTSKVILPVVETTGIAYVAPLTGARLLREPFRPMVFNLRASYHQEINLLIEELERAGRHQVAVAYNKDAYGEDGLQASQTALAKLGLRAVAIEPLQRDSTDTEGAARRIQAADANAVLIISTYRTSASLSRNLRQVGSRAQLMNLSPVGISGLEDALPGGQANGIGVSQVFPFPWNRRVPVVAQYQRLMQQQQTEARYGYTSLEGFLAARWLTAALEKAGPNPNRARVVEAFQDLKSLDLGGFKLQLGPGDNQASDLVELTFLGSQRWGP